MNNCMSCGEPMEVVHKTKSKKGYNIIRYHCSVCDISETLHGSGDVDKIAIPQQALKDIQKYYKEEEEKCNI